MKDSNEIIVHYKDNMASYLLSKHLKPLLAQDTIIVCIGTDKCIGDCLGPLVGTLLQKKNILLKVYGTLNDPIHGVNLTDKIIDIKEVHPFNPIIAIDACLGDGKNIGTIQVRERPIYPGKGVGKKLPSVGNVSIIGIVDAMKVGNGLSLHNIRLSLVMDMAVVIADGIWLASL